MSKLRTHENLVERLARLENELKIVQRRQLSRAVQSYTPTITASVTNPNLGTNPTQEGFYKEEAGMIHCWGSIVWGSSPSVGSGVYYVSLPVTADATYYDEHRSMVGTGFVIDNSGSANNTLTFMSFGDSMSVIRWRITASSHVTNSNPFTPAVGDDYRWEAWYVPA